MAFPFRAPFDGWVQEVLDIREKNPIIATMKNPFVVMTSAAKVVKDTAGLGVDPKDRLALLEKILDPKNQKPSKDVYEGCIISNNVNNVNLSYSHTSGTPIGIDLTGKIVTVDGETDRFVSTPIIESLDIDTSGTNNTLKTATVKVRCFTLKQLEMFEMFFMKPGMNLLIEYGDASLLSGVLKYQKPDSINRWKVWRNGLQKPVTPAERIEQVIIPKNEGIDTFIDKHFVTYFRSGLENSIKYFEQIESSLGTYDLIAGKVLTYSFSYEEDGTYECEIKVSQSNQISLAMPNTPAKKGASRSNPPKNTQIDYIQEDQIMDSIILNFNGIDKEPLTALLNKTKHPETGKAGANEWIKKELFNFVKIDTAEKDQKASSEAYMSLRFILKILMNYVFNGEIYEGSNLQEDFFKLSLPKTKINGKIIDVIPITSNVNLISSNAEVIFPSAKLPKISVSPKGENKTIKAEDRIVIDPKNKVNGLVNGYDINLPDTSLEIFYGDGSDQDIKNTIKSVTENNNIIGNALNIFIKYETVVRIWNQELFRIDFLEKILDLVNKQGYGLYQLVFSTSGDDSSAKSTIIDLKLHQNTEIHEEPNEPLYRFKIGPKNSILRNFSFNFEMTNLVAAQSIYGNQKTLYAAVSASRSGGSAGGKNIQSEDMSKLYKSVDRGSMVNADGWWAINYVDYKVGLAKIEDSNKKYDQLSKSTQQSGVGEKPDEEEQTEEEKVSSNEEEVLDLIKGNTIFFQDPADSTKKKQIGLIYLDKSFILEKVNAAKPEKTNITLSPIDITFTIDGFSGFRAGHTYHIDGVPEIYNRNGQFQVGNIKHSLSNDGWTTTVDSTYLANPPKKDGTGVSVG